MLLLNSSEAPTGTSSRYLSAVVTQMQQLSFRKQQKASMLKCHTRKSTDRRPRLCFMLNTVRYLCLGRVRAFQLAAVALTKTSAVIVLSCNLTPLVFRSVSVDTRRCAIHSAHGRGVPGVTFGLRLLANHAERGRDAGAVSTLPGNVRVTSDPVREAAVQVAFSETLTPACLIRCNLKRKSGPAERSISDV